MATMSEISMAGDAVGGAAQDIFGAIGARTSVKSLRKAADLADQSQRLSKVSTSIRTSMAQREIYKTIGGQKADIAGGGFSMSGSAIDLFRDSTAQGALTTQLIKTQGAIDANEYKAMATSYRGQADAADAAATGGMLSGVVKAITAVASIAVML